MPLFKDFSSIMEQNQPRLINPGYRATSIGQVKGKTREGMGSAYGQPLGAVAGALIGRYFSPDRLRNEALQARELISQMPDDLRERLIMQPRVQERLRKFQKVVPEIFADASVVRGNPDMQGMIDFVDQVRGAEEKIKRAEADKPAEQTQLYRGTEAEIGGRQAETGLREAQTQAVTGEEERTEELHPFAIEAARLGIDLTEEQIKKLRAETTQTKAATQIARQEEGRAQQIFPEQVESLKVETELKRGQNVLARAQAGYYDRMPQQTNELALKMQNEKDKSLLEWRSTQATEANKLYKRDVEDGFTAQFSERDVEDTIAFVKGFGNEVFDGVAIPRAIIEPVSIAWINRSFDIALNALDQELTNTELMPTKEHKNLYQNILSLYRQTYALTTEDAIQQNPQYQLVKGLYDPDIENKLRYMRYLVGRDLMSPDERKQEAEWAAQYRPVIEQKGGFFSLDWVMNGLGWAADKVGIGGK